MDHDSTLKAYLSKLNAVTLLSREEEDSLLKIIETTQSQILRECAAIPLFRSEMLAVLEAKDTADIVKISKRLTEESSGSEVAGITAAFKELLAALRAGHINVVQEKLRAVNLSGTIVYELVTEIKKKYTQASDRKLKLRQLFDFFEVKSEMELAGLIEEIRSSDVAKRYHAIRLETPEQRLLARAHEYTEYLDAASSSDDWANAKGLYDLIISAERHMKSARDELIERNLRLVVSRAKKFTNRGLDLDDLIQEGNIGLIKAIDKHDSSRGTKVATYATWWIDQSIRRAISNKSKTVRIPTHIEFFQTQLSSAVAKLTNELGRVPTKEEIAKRAGVAIDALEKLDQIALHKIGIDDESSTGLSVMDLLPSDPSESPFNVAVKKLLREKVRQILATLPARSEKIIRLRFGIGETQEEMTLQQIADQVDLTKMGVRLVQNTGLAKIKKRGELNDY